MFSEGWGDLCQYLFPVSSSAQIMHPWSWNEPTQSYSTSMLSDTTQKATTCHLLYLQWRSLARRCDWFWGSQRPRPSEAEGGWPASAPVLRERVQSVLSLPTQAPPMLLGPSGVAWNKAFWETSWPKGVECRGDGDENGKLGEIGILGRGKGQRGKRRCRRTWKCHGRGCEEWRSRWRGWWWR